MPLTPSVFALGIMPYISASIIMQLLTVVHPTFAEYKKEGDAGKRKINQWTRGNISSRFSAIFGIATGLPNMVPGLVVNLG